MIPIAQLPDMAVRNDNILYEVLSKLATRSVCDDFKIASTAPLTVNGTQAGSASLFSSPLTVGLYLPNDTTKFLRGDGTWTTVPTGIPLFTPGSVIFADGVGALSQDNANFFWDDALNRLGLATASPNATLDVRGTLRVGDDSHNNYPADSPKFYFATATTNAVGNWTATNASGNGAQFTMRSDGSGAGAKMVNANWLGTIGFRGKDDVGFASGSSALIAATATETWSSTAHGTKLEFGVTPNASTTRSVLASIDPAIGVDVGTATTHRVRSYGGFVGNATANIDGTGAAAYFPSGLYAPSSSSNSWLYGSINFNGAINAAGATNINGANFSFAGDFGGALRLLGARSGVNGGAGSLYVRDTAALAANVGGAIVFSGAYTSAPAYTEFAAIQAYKDNATSGDFAGGLAFYTRTNGVGAWTVLGSGGPGAAGVSAVLTSAGYFGVGTPTPARLIDAATTGFIRGKMQDYGGHVHNVLAYGAVADALYVTDGAMDNNVTFALTCATSTPFTAADVGKPISVTGAGAAGAVLYTTISGYTSSSVVTLAAKNTSGAAISAKMVSWGTDNTAAFAAADAAAVALYPLLGFGTVYVPRGVYRFSTHLTVSARCALRGELDNPAYGQQGSILHFVEGSGSGSGTAAITLGEGSTIAGLLIMRPNQPITGDPIAFPFDVKMPAYSTARNISFLGSYQGIDAASTTTGSYCSDTTIEGIYGDVAYIGIDVDRCYDTGHIADVHFYPFWTQDSTRMTWKHGNAIGVRFGRSDWQVVENFFALGVGTGMQFNHSSAASGAGGTSGCFSNVQIDSCKYGIDATETGYQGVQFANLAVSGGGAGIDAYGIRTNYNASYKCNITAAGYKVWGTPLWGVYHDSLGHVAISNGQFIQQTGNNSFQGVYVGRDSAMIEGSQFRFDTAAYVALQSDTNATNVRFNGNVLNGCTLTISNTKTTLDGSFPWPAASAYNSAAQSINNAAATALTFNTNLYDNGVHSTSTNPTRFTAPTGLGTGLFSFVGCVTFATLAGGVSRQLQLWKNGATQIAQTTFPFANNAAALTLELAWQGQLAPGDYLELYAYQDSGAAANTTGGEPNTRGSLTRLS